MPDNITPDELIDLIALIAKIKVEETSSSHPDDVVCQLISVAEVLSEEHSIIWRQNRA